MPNTILRDLSIFWCMIHVILLFTMLFRSRYPRKRTIVLAVAGMGILMTFNGVLLLILGIELLGKIFFFTCSIPSFIFFYVLSADKRARFLLTFCLADTSCYWIMIVTNMLNYFFGGGSYILMFILRLFAFPLLEYCAYRFWRKPYMELQDSVEKGWGIFAGMTMLYYVLLVVMANYPVNIVERPKDVLSCVLVLILMFFNYAVIFSALYRQLLLYRRQQSERILQEQKNLLEEQLENQQRIRKLKHDMRGHTAAIVGLLASGKTKETLAYLKNIEVEMDACLGQYCANPYINAVFSSYVQKFEDLGAKLHIDIQIGDESIHYMELCQILSNGLENIRDALRELPVPKREASVQMKYNRKHLVIRMKNCCKEDLFVEKGTIPATSKESSDHGFGQPTILEAAQKLVGDMMCYTENGSFMLDVMIQIEKLQFQ